MKINEHFGPVLEQEGAEESSRMELELLAQMKSEFQEFVAQTRERLRLVSESLMDLDREYALAPPITDQQPAGAPDVNVPEVNVPNVNAPEVNVPNVNAPDVNVQEVNVQDVNVQEVVGVQSVVDAAVEPASADGPELIVDSAASDRVQSDRVQSEAPVSELDFWPSEPSEPDPRPSFTEDASKDATFPGTSDPDSDPSERLNAIKQRLARQIENS